MKESERFASEAKAILDSADLENRDTTPEEEGRIYELLAKSREAREQKSGVRDLVKGIGGGSVTARAGDGSGRMFYGTDAGRAFIESEGFKSVSDSGMRGQTFSTGPVEVPLMAKGTILEGPGAPGTGTGGGFLPAPQIRPGVVEKLLAPPLAVADLFGQALATSNTVRYVVEGTATSAATGVAEAATKPESTIALSTVDEPVRKIATSLVVSDEVLDDAAAAAGFINGELTRCAPGQGQRNDRSRASSQGSGPRGVRA